MIGAATVSCNTVKRRIPLPGSALCLLGSITAGVLLAACSTTSRLPPGGTPTFQSAPSRLPRGGSGASVPREQPATRYPPPVNQAVDYLSSRVQGIPIVAPEQLPPASNRRPLSAQVRYAPGSYAISLYACVTAEPLNSSHIGTGSSCGAMADYYGSFGGQKLPSSQAAEKALRQYAAPDAPPPTCQQTLPVRSSAKLGDNVTASVSSCPAGPSTWAMWTEGGWSIELMDAGPASGSWQSVAMTLATYLASKSPPSGAADLVVSVAPDGNHSECAWVSGSDLYDATNYHSAESAAALAASASTPHQAR